MQMFTFLVILSEKEQILQTARQCLAPWFSGLHARLSIKSCTHVCFREFNPPKHELSTTLQQFR